VWPVSVVSYCGVIDVEQYVKNVYLSLFYRINMVMTGKNCSKSLIFQSVSMAMVHGFSAHVSTYMTGRFVDHYSSIWTFLLTFIPLCFLSFFDLRLLFMPSVSSHFFDYYIIIYSTHKVTCMWWGSPNLPCRNISVKKNKWKIWI
jgi:hypothetical protein